VTYASIPGDARRGCAFFECPCDVGAIGFEEVFSWDK